MNATARGLASPGRRDERVRACAREGAAQQIPTFEIGESLPVRSRDGRAAHRADAVELGLLARILGDALAHLVALVEQLDLLELLERLGERKPRLLELALELVGRALQIVAPPHRRLGIGRIGEMRRIVDAGAFLLGRDLAIEVGGHAVEIGHHALDLRNAAPLLVDLKFPQANERFTRLHRLLLPRSAEISATDQDPYTAEPSFPPMRNVAPQR